MILFKDGSAELFFLNSPTTEKGGSESTEKPATEDTKKMMKPKRRKTCIVNCASSMPWPPTKIVNNRYGSRYILIFLVSSIPACLNESTE